MKVFLDKYKNYLYYLLPVVLLGGLIYAATSMGSAPLFQNTDDFLLFTQKELKLEKEVQASSGDIGSNDEIEVGEDNIITGNLFADEIEIDEDSTINGNATYNELELDENSQILGEQEDSISLPIANIPNVPNFQIGTQNLTFQGNGNTLVSGDYKNIKLKKSSTLTLQGGTYNLRSLRLEKNSTLIFDQPTTLNIQQKLTGDKDMAILPGLNLNQNDLQINFQGKTQEDDEEEDDNDNDNDDHSFFQLNSAQAKEKDDDNDDEDEDNDHEGGFIHFGKNSFLNFKLFAPTATIRLGKQTTFRGQILASTIQIGKGSVLSREESFVEQSNQDQVVQGEDGAHFLINEIIITLSDSATAVDVIEFANMVGGIISGHIVSINSYKIKVDVETIDELELFINDLEALNDIRIESITKNYILGTI